MLLTVPNEPVKRSGQLDSQLLVAQSVGILIGRPSPITGKFNHFAADLKLAAQETT